MDGRAAGGIPFKSRCLILHTALIPHVARIWRFGTHLADSAKHLASIAKPATAMPDRLYPATTHRYRFMDHQDPELEKAREELSFWRDYAAWWDRVRGNATEPRIREALELAEARYREVRLRRQMTRLL